jgi:MoaA/NifB/PqqE/SkfB family radical SAM enzyme
MLKIVRTDKYAIVFNPKTGMEILSGINGNPDPFVLDFPSLMDIGIMGNCLNNCAFCYQGENKGANMKLEDYKKIIDEAEPYVMQVALGGKGDPNLHENFKEIVEYTRSRNIIPNYTTSGNNLSDEQVEISKLCGAVAVSDYNQEFSYRAISKLGSAKIKSNIHFVYSRSRSERAFEILKGRDVWEGKVDLEKLNAVIFLLFKPQGRGKNLTHEIPTEEQIKVFASLVNEHKTKFKIWVDRCLVNKIKKLNMFPKEQEQFVDTCEGSRASVYVSPDMKLIPCSFGNHDEYGISIKDKSIKEVWTEGKSFKEFRKILTKEPACCPFGL